MKIEFIITALILILAVFIIYKNIKKSAKGGCNCGGCSKASCPSRTSSPNNKNNISLKR